MKRNKPKTARIKGSLIAAIGVGVIVSLLLSISLTALLSSAILNNRVDENNINAVVFAIRSVSLLIGTLIGGKILGQRYLQLSGTIAAGFLFMVIAAGIIFFDGSFQNFLAGIASVLLGSISSLLILLHPKASKYKPRKNRR